MKKIVNYYRAFGFKETLKKIKRYVYIFINKHLSSNGIYTPSKKELANIILKNKKVYVFSKVAYDKLECEKKEILKKINCMGFQIYYFYITGEKCYNNPPLSVQKKYSTRFFNKEKISQTAYCLILNKEDTKLFMDCINDFNKKKIICLGEENKLNYDFQKCDKNFYDNISIIVLNHNNENIINICLDNLLKFQKRYKYEIIVVDNVSTDNSINIIKKYKDVKLFKNSKNGCSSGRNLGVSKTTKDYIMFLDSDQWPQNEFWIDNYIDIFKKEGKNVGAIGWTAGWFNNSGYAFHTVDNFEYRYMPPMCLGRKDVGYIGSGGMMMTRKIFNEIGGFDENYDPTCYEDTDISLKIRDYNKEIIYCPYLGIEHLPHQTTKSGSLQHEKLIKKRGKYFINKWKQKNPELLDYKK